MSKRATETRRKGRKVAQADAHWKSRTVACQDRPGESTSLAAAGYRPIQTLFLLGLSLELELEVGVDSEEERIEESLCWVS